MKPSELIKKLEQDTGEPESRYLQFVLDAAQGNVDTAEHQRRRFVIQEAGRNASNFLDDVKTAEQLLDSLAHIKATDAAEVDRIDKLARRASETWLKDYKPQLEAELQLMGAKISKALTDAQKACNRLSAAKSFKSEARRRNRPLADLVEQAFKDAEKTKK